VQELPQRPIAPQTDLRDMLRRYLVGRSLDAMERSAERRQRAIATGRTREYIDTIKGAVRGFYGPLPVGPDAAPVEARVASTYAKQGYRIESVLFESFPGWEVNATIYVPTERRPPFPAVVVPVGHSGKQFESYQLPCQFFARHGYIAITFDPPGQAGEKQPGNDHFADGVRCYLVGESSSRYFVADALRCLDYLETRADVNNRLGFAMTGVSGGGTTTTLAALLDDRIKVIGPSCCVTPLADLDISQCYAGCPETHMWGRYAEGIDEIDLICAAAPKPVMLMAGQQDEVFRIEDTRELALEALAFYRRVGAEDRCGFFEDPGGHAYSLRQAHCFSAFMDIWLRNERMVQLLPIEAESYSLSPYEELRCQPRTDVNMRGLSVTRAADLRARRDAGPETVRRAAAELAGVTEPVPVPQAEVGEPFRVWTHYWQQIMLRPEEGIELPATLLRADSDDPAPTLLHIDDSGRHRLMARQGPLVKAAGFIEREHEGGSVLSIDLRGWGDTQPALYPYELAGWGGIDRYLCYTTAALGDSIMAMRIRDGLSALAYLRSRPDTGRIVLSGCGLGGVVSRHVAAIDGDVDGLVVWDDLRSFEDLVAEESWAWPQDAVYPNVLLHYDIPELTAAIGCEVIELAPGATAADIADACAKALGIGG